MTGGPAPLRALALGLAGLTVVAPCLLAAIDTDFLERPWPKQWVREFEVGRHPVRWRQRASKRDGLFAGVQFTAPLPQQAVWDLANDYQDIGHITPGVRAVRYLERSETREVIQLDVQVLWKQLTLTFEVEKEPPRVMRFRLVHETLGEYRGVSVFTEGEAAGEDHPAGTGVELATWLLPNRPVPMGLLLVVERMVMLQAAREFLETCERAGGASRGASR